MIVLNAVRKIVELCSFNIKYWTSEGFPGNLIGFAANERYFRPIWYIVHGLLQEQMKVPGETFLLTHNLR